MSRHPTIQSKKKSILGEPSPNGSPTKELSPPSPSDHEREPQLKTAHFGSGRDNLHRYFHDAVKVPLITREEEIALAQRAQRGDAAARERMILSNLRLVISIAKNYEGFGLPLLDLINEGNIGLMHAVDKFDPDKAKETGAKLSTYASHWIKQSILRSLAASGNMIRLPIQRGALIREMMSMEQRLLGELGREPTNAELSEASGLSLELLQKLKENEKTRRIVPLDMPLRGHESNHDDRALHDILPDLRIVPANDDLAQQEMARIINAIIGDAEALQGLEPHLQSFANRAKRLFHERELYILRRRYGLSNMNPCTLQDLGTEGGVTRERIRQIEHKALRKLRSILSKLDERRDPVMEEMIETVSAVGNTKKVSRSRKGNQ